MSPTISQLSLLVAVTLREHLQQPTMCCQVK